MKAFRIADIRHPIFDGYGAFRYGGRWNSPGRFVIYCAETYSGARLEQLVHLPFGHVPKTQRVVTIDIPEDMACEELVAADLPRWNAEDQAASRAFGDRWYDEKRAVVLIVPSVAAPGERNVLINQHHPDFNQIRATRPAPVIWDERLFMRPGPEGPV